MVSTVLKAIAVVVVLLVTDCGVEVSVSISVTVLSDSSIVISVDVLSETDVSMMLSVSRTVLIVVLTAGAAVTMNNARQSALPVEIARILFIQASVAQALDFELVTEVSAGAMIALPELDTVAESELSAGAILALPVGVVEEDVVFRKRKLVLVPIGATD